MAPPKKNGFVFFIEERMAELKIEGASLPDAVKDPALTSEWEKMPAEKKSEYKKAAEMLRKNKPYTKKDVIPKAKLVSDGEETPRYRLLTHDDDEKKTTFGFTLGQIRTIQRQKVTQKLERKLQCKALADIRNQNGGDPRTNQITLIKFSAYCCTDAGDYIPAEIGMVTFSLQDGIIDNYAALIDPGEPPRGSRFECMNTAQANGLPVPPYSEYCRDYERILNEIQNYIDSHPPCLEGRRLLFCTRPDTAIAESCLKWLYKACQIPEPEEKRKHALRPIGLLFLNMYRSGSEFHDKVKEAEQLLPPDEAANMTSPQLFYKCGVPFFNIKDGRIRTRRLDFYDGLQVYDQPEQEQKPEEQVLCHGLELQDTEAIGGSDEFILASDRRGHLFEGQEGNQWNFVEPSEPFDSSDQDQKWKREARNNLVSQYLYEKHTTPPAKVEFQTILEENEDGTGNVDGQAQPKKSKNSNRLSYLKLKPREDKEEIPEHYYRELKEVEEDLHFVLRSRQQAGFANESPNALAEIREIVQALQEKGFGPILDWLYTMEYDTREYWLGELVTGFDEGEPKEPKDKENGETRKGPEEAGVSTTKVSQSRTSIWSAPLRERKPGDPEQYGDVDPLLSILWEGDAMEYLRSLDCAYIAELCCPHHTVNNDCWENCPLNLLNRIALNFLDVTVGFWGIVPVEGKHYPYRNTQLEGQKRMDWSKNKFGHQQYGYKDLPGFKNSGEFKSDDVGCEKPEPEEPASDLELSDLLEIFDSNNENTYRVDEEYEEPEYHDAGEDENEYSYFE